MAKKQYAFADEMWWELMVKHCRTLDQASEDGLLPYVGFADYDVFASQRHLAIGHVLCTMPPDDYEGLKAVADSFSWFLPDSQNLGRVQPFPITVKGEERLFGGTYAKVLWFSPELECRAWDIVVALVAHELAHLALQHSVVCSADEYERQEAEAWEQVCEWGFGAEVKKHERMRKWRASYEEYPWRKLKEEIANDVGG